MLEIKLIQRHPGQCHIHVGKHRVGFVCFGESKPINWLPKSVTGLPLTDEEKLTVAKTVRDEMARENEKRDRVQNELAALSGKQPTKTPNENDNTQQSSDLGSGNIAQDRTGQDS